MRKLNALRRHLTAVLPELAREPDALDIYAVNGTLVTRLGANLGYEQRYSARVVLQNFRGTPEQVFLPLLLWLRKEQPELFLNHDTGNDQIKFSVDVLDQNAVDIEFDLPLTEAVDVLPDGAGGYKMKIREEVAFPDDLPLVDPAAVLRQIWAPGAPGSAFLVGHPDTAAEAADGND